MSFQRAFDFLMGAFALAAVAVMAAAMFGMAVFAWRLALGYASA